MGEHLGVGRDHMYSLVTFRIVVPNILGNPPPNASIAIYKTTFDFELKYVPPKVTRFEKNTLFPCKHFLPCATKVHPIIKHVRLLKMITKKIVIKFR